MLDVFVDSAAVPYSIIEAIAAGDLTWRGTTRRVGRSGGPLLRALEWLQAMGLVERVAPITERQPHRPKRVFHRTCRRGGRGALLRARRVALRRVRRSGTRGMGRTQVILAIEPSGVSYGALKPAETVLIHSHGPFAGGPTGERAAENVSVTELLAEMAFHSLQIDPELQPVSRLLPDRRFSRQHGKDACQGQPAVLAGGA